MNLDEVQVGAELVYQDGDGPQIEWRVTWLAPPWVRLQLQSTTGAGLVKQVLMSSLKPRTWRRKGAP